MSANEKQIAGNHYATQIQHWDYVVANDLDYFQGQITKYVTRWKRKNGMVDLLKAQHFLEKYIEVVNAVMAAQAAQAAAQAAQAVQVEPEAEDGDPGPGYVKQD